MPLRPYTALSSGYIPDQARLAESILNQVGRLFRVIMIQITHGAPKTAVTVLMLSSVGAKRVLAMRSEKRQNTAPPRKHAGIMTIGFCVFMRFLIR